MSLHRLSLGYKEIEMGFIRLLFTTIHKTISEFTDKLCLSSAYSQLGTKPTRLQDISVPSQLGPQKLGPKTTRPQDISALVNSAPELYLVYKEINEST